MHCYALAGSSAAAPTRNAQAPVQLCPNPVSSAVHFFASAAALLCMSSLVCFETRTTFSNCPNPFCSAVHFFASADKAKRVLGWQPHHNFLKDVNQVGCG